MCLRSFDPNFLFAEKYFFRKEGKGSSPLYS